MGFMDVDVDVKNTYSENIVENIQNSQLLNRTDNYNKQDTKLQNIKEYLTDLVHRTTNENEVSENVTRNMSTVGEVIQTNDLILENVKIEGASDVNIEQINETTQKITKNFNQYRQEIIDTINQAVSNTEVVKEVEDAMEVGTFDEYLNDLLTEAEQKANQSSTSQVKSESFKFERREHILSTEVNVNNIHTKSRNTNVSNELVENVCVASVISNTDLYNKISQAYNNTVETTMKIKREVNDVTNDKLESLIKQQNKLKISGLVITNDSKNINISQINKTRSEIEAVALITNITNLTSKNYQDAIASDMLGITQNMKTISESKGKTSSSAKGSQGTDQVTGTTTELSKSRIASIIGTIAGVVIIVVVAWILVKFLGKTPQGKVAQVYAQGIN